MVVTAKLSRKPFIELPVEVYESLSFNLTLRGVNMKNIFIITLLLIFVTAALFAWEAQGVAETLAQKSEQNAPETVEVQITLLKHYLSNYHQHQYTLNNYIRWLHENTLLRNKTESVPVVELTDESIHKATILFMTGKDLAIAIATRDLRQRIQGIRPLTEVEKDALKRYIIEYGGTFFFNYGGGNGSLKYIVREELKDIFNEYEWITVPLEHDIYQTPNNLSGASVAKSKLRGIVIDGRLAVICTEEDLLQKSKTSEEVRQLLVNLLFYALMSTDRFPWVPRENRILQVYVIANFYYERAQKKKEIDDYEGYIQDIEKACESYLKVLELAGYLQEPGGEDRIISEHDPQIAKYLWAIVKTSLLRAASIANEINKLEYLEEKIIPALEYFRDSIDDTGRPDLLTVTEEEIQEARFYLGLGYFKLGQYEKAIREFEWFISHTPDETRKTKWIR